DSHGFVYELAVRPLGGVKELRWQCRSPDGSSEPTTLRHVIGALQSYEPARTLTARALRGHRGDAEFSVVALRAELERIAASQVLALIAREGLGLAPRDVELE